MYSIILLVGDKRVYIGCRELPNYKKAISELHRRFPTAELYTMDDRTPQEPPGGKYRPRGKTHWCPYCHSERPFYLNDLDYLCCKVCGISTMDFYTRKYNGLFDTEFQQMVQMRKDAEAGEIDPKDLAKREARKRRKEMKKAAKGKVTFNPTGVVSKSKRRKKK